LLETLQEGQVAGKGRNLQARTRVGGKLLQKGGGRAERRPRGEQGEREAGLSSREGRTRKGGQKSANDEAFGQRRKGEAHCPKAPPEDQGEKRQKRKRDKTQIAVREQRDALSKAVRSVAVSGEGGKVLQRRKKDDEDERRLPSLLFITEGSGSQAKQD